jgi:hypothetical protein
MTELSPANDYGAYPHLFPGDQIASQPRITNKVFVENLVPWDRAALDDLGHIMLEGCATALDETDYQYGRNTGTMGYSQYAPRALGGAEGLWDVFSMPTFYHDGDGTRLAMAGTANYMDYCNDTDSNSPYNSPKVYLETLVTAAFDDIVFGVEGRGGDERLAAAIAKAYLESKQVPASTVAAVVTGIEASEFSETTFSQKIDPAKGHMPVQVGSVTGDLWQLGTPVNPMASMLLGVENLWKADTAKQYGQLLRRRAVQAAVEWPGGFHPKKLTDFFTFIDSDNVLRIAFGEFMVNNKDFLASHAYYEDRINELMAPGKEQNGILQASIGEAILDGMSLHNAFHCAVSYAVAKPSVWATGREKHAALKQQLYPASITAALLRRRKAESLGHPVDASRFITRYMQEVT